MTISPGFTLCFLLHDDDVLMLHRRYPPNQGLWNGVGGHIEPGESPRHAMIREIAEETGYQIDHPQFAGLLSWEGYEVPPGALTIFTARVPHKNFINNHEGELAWKPRDWVCTSPEVVDNILVFLPLVFADDQPQHYHFIYQDGKRIEDIITPLPEGFNPDLPIQLDTERWEEQRGAYLLSFDKERLQLDRIENFIARQSYWAKNRPLEVIKTSIQHSVCLGIYHHGRQVGFARMVTDQSTFAWLADVFVDKEHRNQGLGKWLLEASIRFVDQRKIRRMVLITKDAQSLYETYGDFAPLDDSNTWLQRVRLYWEQE